MNKPSAVIVFLFLVALTPTLAAPPTDCSLYPSVKGLDSTIGRLDFMQKVRKAELKSGGFRKKRLLCQVTIRPDGTVAELEIVASSGSAVDDEDILALIRAASPFRPYNPKFGNSSCLVEFFDSLRPFAGSKLSFDFTVKSVNAN